MGRNCDFCYKAFKEGDDLITLSNGTESSIVHGTCEDEWHAERAQGAPSCDVCQEKIYPLSEGMTLQLPGKDMATLHSKCQDKYLDIEAPKCDHCDKAITLNLVKITSMCPNTSSQKDFSVHEGCQVAFEADLKARRTKTTTTYSGKPTVLTPPSKPRALKGVKCAHCHKTNKTQSMMSLPGPWGAANVHCDCAEEFEKQQELKDPGMGTSGTSRCDGCLKRFSTHDLPVIVKQPGGTKMVEMHDACYKRQLAKHGGR